MRTKKKTNIVQSVGHCWDLKQKEPYLKLADLYEEQSEPEKAEEILRQGFENTGSSEIEKKYSLYTYVSDVLIPEIGQCSKGPFECEYKSYGKYDIYLKPVHSEKGVITSKIADFDQDGEEELLVFALDNMGTAENAKGNVNTVYLSMYENNDGKIEKQDEYEVFENVLGVKDEEDDWVFLKEHEGQTYICGSRRQRFGLFVNGEQLTIFAITYDGKEFHEYLRGEMIGSGFGGLETDIDEKLDAIGLPKGAAQIRKTREQYFPADELYDEVCFHIFGKNEYVHEESAEAKKQLEKFYENYDVAYIGKMIVQIKVGERGEPIFQSDKDAVESSKIQDEKNQTQMDEEDGSIDYVSLYGPILNQTYNRMEVHGEYYIYDINKDGVFELMVLEGTGEADAKFHVYSIADKKVYDLGLISAWHAALYADEGNGAEPYIIEAQQLMGGETISHITIEAGKAVLTEIYSKEAGVENYYTNPYQIPYAELTDLSLLENIEGN